ncbi:hypothetical protein Q8O96_24900 [Pseudomonas sp. LPH60]|uniref:hypothetical protein n=1 Tax=Pseudomonas sp. LPH60 TaxID=3065906 RepID=UPI00273AD77C|nr:hypothetical protein [Pseudomonas sp. LPH60]MDP4572317.1 hypothetical protein [Pseudomonas sp. LPH60]
MSIDPINIGGAPNDGNGQNLRSGGQIINDNFAELDTRTAAAQARADQGVSDAAAAKAKADAAVPGSALGVSVAQLVDGLIPASQLPSFVDDVLEFPTMADFPATGETGKIYIAINDGDSPANPTRQYRWSGSAFVLIPSSPGSTDQVPEGPTNQYFTQSRVRSTTLSGLGALVNAAILATDTVLQAFAKLQGQLNAKLGKNEVATDSNKLGGQPADFYTALMAGATATAGGVKGLVPAPAAGDQAKFLTGAGTYAAPSTTQTSWGGIAGLISDQADLKAALDAKVAIAGLGLSKKWSSGPISWSVAGVLNLTHNLGFEPAIVVVKGRYKAAVNGMAIGESEFSVGILYQSAFLGVIARKPTTTTLQIQVARDGLRLSNAAGELVAVTPAQVDLVVELWA